MSEKHLSYPANMKPIIFSIMVLIFFVTPVWTQKTVRAERLISKQATISERENVDFPIEEFSFLIEDFKMNHQSEINNLNIKVRVRYENNISDGRYPDFRAIAKDIKDFLSNYPNKIDYWEILNKKLTLLVLKKYSMIENITSEIQVSPSEKVAYLRSSIVTQSRSKRRTK